MLERIKTYLADEDGAVTVDWVVMTAAVVGLGTAAVGTVEDGITLLAADISAAISTVQVDNGNSE